MFVNKIHRNSQKRIYRKNAVYFITTKTYKNISYFEEDVFCRLFLSNIFFCQKLKEYFVYAFVIMPEHVHLLVRPYGDFNISQIVQNLKRTTSLKINQAVGHYHIEGANIYSRLHEEIENKLVHFRWQKSFHDHIIRCERDFIEHFKYIIRNPIKNNLIKEGQNYKYFYVHPKTKYRLQG